MEVALDVRAYGFRLQIQVHGAPMQRVPQRSHPSTQTPRSNTALVVAALSPCSSLLAPLQSLQLSRRHQAAEP